LRWCAVVLLREFLQHWELEHSCLSGAGAESREGGDVDSLSLLELDQVLASVEGRHFELVHGGSDASIGEEIQSLTNGEVGDTDGLDQAFVVELEMAGEL